MRRWTFGLAAMVASLVVGAAPADARISARMVKSGIFHLAVSADVTVAALDEWTEENCPDDACSVIAFRMADPAPTMAQASALSARRVYIVDRLAGNETRRVNCAVYQPDDDHGCIGRADAPIALPDDAPRRASRLSGTATLRRTVRRAPVPRTPRAAGTSGRYFASCRDARAAGAAPLRAGSANYAANSRLDRDHDGVACE